MTAGKTSRHQVKRSCGCTPLQMKTARVTTSSHNRTASLYLNLIAGRDFLFAVEHRAGELLKLAIVAGPRTHGLARIGEARHVEHLHERLERDVTDLVFADVVETAIERRQLRHREIRRRLVRQRSRRIDELERVGGIAAGDAVTHGIDDLLLPQLAGEIVPLGAEDVAVARIGQGAVSGEMLRAAREAVLKEI